MARLIRSIACLIVAAVIASAGLVWIRVPHADASPGHQIVATYDAGVGMIDLYLRHDYRGMERLVDVDPTLAGLGGEAARSVAADHDFDLEQRVHATALLATNQRLDESFSRVLAEAAKSHHEETAFCNIDQTLDVSLGCTGA